jgi:hypothetical protein
MYDDNIYIKSTGEEDDFLWVFTPGIHIGSGDYGQKEENFTLINYEPDLVVFTHNNNQNDIDHDALLQIQRRPGKWTLNLAQGFTTFSGADVDIGDRADETMFLTTLGAEYEFSPKTSAELNLHQTIDDYEGSTSLDGFNEWSAEAWADYHITPKVRLGAGVTAGIVDIRGSENQTYEQPLVRVVYELSGKVDLRASGGVEFRQFEGDKDNRTDGVFSLGGTYRPWENVSVNVDAHHRNQNSVRLADQNYRSTGIRGTLIYDLFVKYHLLLGGGYEFINYYSTASGVAAPREDDYYFARLGASWDVLDKLNIGVFYQYRDNDSNLGNFSFENNQVGLTTAYRF